MESASPRAAPEAAVYDPRIRPEYYSVISVKKGNGISSLADLRGRTFTFVEPADLKAKIRESLLSTPMDAELVKSSKRWYVDPSKEMGLPNLDAYYNELREVAKLLDLDLKGVDYK